MSVEADMSESLADRKSVWSGVEDELRALIVAPDDIDSVGVTTNQGVARRALLHIAELKAENAELHQKIVQEAWSDWTKYESWKIQELEAQLAEAQATIKRLTKGD